MRNILNGLWIAFLFSMQIAFISAAEPLATSTKALKTVTLNVQKMDCPMCKITIRKALKKVAGVKDTKVHYDAKTASVTFDPELTNIKALTQATTNAGYPSTLKIE